MLDQARKLLENAENNIHRYNQFCLHYNLVANAVYEEWRRLGPFSPQFEPYVIAALISFDMGRMMGKGMGQRYDVSASGFALRLHRKLAHVQRHIEPIAGFGLLEVSIEEHTRPIVAAYDALAYDVEEPLDSRGRQFDVGTTKILHFLNPELFAIVDGNTAKTLQQACGIPYHNSTRHGYSGPLYIRSLLAIQALIADFGLARFRSLDNGSPLMRTFDKLAFAFNAFPARTAAQHAAGSDR